ncbi:hypothetical protein ABH927_001721 [Planotetraspora sp. GP83]
MPGFHAGGSPEHLHALREYIDVMRGHPAALGLGGPRTRDVQLPVHRRVAATARVDEVDGDLRVLDPAAVPVYWHWTPTVCVPFFTSPVTHR